MRLGATVCGVALGTGLSYTNPAQCAVRPPTLQPAENKVEVYDVCVVGGGIVGLATAREVINRFPKMRVAVVEKESEVAHHQTGHNSGVIHAGMYYVPGSTMARLCVQGAKMMYEYCEKNNIPHKRIGKLIVATTDDEVPILKTLYERGNINGVQGLELLNSAQVRELEPNVAAVAALHSPNTGIVDYGVVARTFARDVVESNRGTVYLDFNVENFTLRPDNTVRVTGCELGQKGPKKHVDARHVITCAGLQSDRVAGLAGGSSTPRIVPFRGTYYQMKEQYRGIVKRNIYPVPSGGGIPVGVHFTPTVNERRGEQMIVGPGACLAFSREGYSFFDLSLKDMLSLVRSCGLVKFALGNADLAFGEMYRDLNKKAFLASAQKLVPSVTEDMVEESFAGVMAQVFEDTGKACAEFIFERNAFHGTTLHVRNAPSPACTASLAIAREVVDQAAADFGWTASSGGPKA